MYSRLPERLRSGDVEWGVQTLQVILHTRLTAIISADERAARTTVLRPNAAVPCICRLLFLPKTQGPRTYARLNACPLLFRSRQPSHSFRLHTLHTLFITESNPTIYQSRRLTRTHPTRHPATLSRFDRRGCHRPLRESFMGKQEPVPPARQSDNGSASQVHHASHQTRVVPQTRFLCSTFPTADLPFNKNIHN